MVPRIVAWSLLGLVVVVLLAALWGGATGAANKSASSAKTSENDSTPSEIGRFQVVRHTPDQIILLDTTTGKLYKAGPDDIQPYENLKKEEEEESKEPDDD